MYYLFLFFQKINSATAPEPSTSAKCTQKHRKKLINTQSNSPKTEITIKSNKESKNMSGSSTKNMPISEVTPKLSKKSINVAVKISPKSTKTTSISDNVASSTSAKTPAKLKNPGNIPCMEVDQMLPSRPTRKASLKAVSNTVNLPITTNKMDRSKRPSATDVSPNTSNDTNNETLRTTRRNLKAQNVSLESTVKSTKTRISDNNAKEFSDKGSTLNVSKAVDVKTYSKSARKSLDIATEIASNSTKNTNKMHQETNAKTPKPTKRPSNTVMVHVPAKQLKPTESAIIIEVVDNNVSKKYPVTKEKAACSNHVKVKKELRSAEPCTILEPTVVPSKVEIIDCTSKDKTVEITIMNPALLNKCIDITVEDSLIAYDSMNTTIEESTISNESVVTMENSTFSSDTAINNSQPTEYYMVLSPVRMSDNVIKCGVCEKSVDETQWIEHISKEHDYIAWRDGEPPLVRKNIQHVRHIRYT